MTRPLPQPTRRRWQPLRAGLVDVFYYDQEEFWFRDGRLLLRGNNGTGKSKVLALTLPFLLDGELAPHRVEPDADQKKRMEWNLLLGGQHPNPERLGYTWLELGRVQEDGSTVFCTLGCGLKAVAGRGIAGHWFFLTGQRVGEDLRLVDAAEIALTRERLEQALGAHGTVFRTSRDYRRAVDETLFGLGSARYSALIDLLIRIRAPQLSKRPNERALSDALTEALPPLDQALIADVAQAFRSLEDDRAELTAVTDARDAAETYVDIYRHYARIACRRRAEHPRRAQSHFDRVSRELAEAEQAHTSAQADLQNAVGRLAALREQDARQRAREQALKESPEARSGRELARAAEDARRTAEQAARARAEHERAGRRVEDLQSRLAAAEELSVSACDALLEARASGLSAARAAGVADAYVLHVDSPIDAVSTAGEQVVGTIHGDADGGAPAEDDCGRETLGLRLRPAAEELAVAQERSIAHIRGLLADAARCAQTLAQARQRVEQLAAEADGLAERLQAAAARVAQAGRELLAAGREQLDGVTAFTVADSAAALAALELWIETLDGPNPLAEAVQAAGRAAAAELARREARLAAQRGEVETELALLQGSIAGLEAGEHDVPLPPHTRAEGVRERRLGAPLFRLVDFREHVEEERRAGIESALEAAGLLDAWVTPDGSLLEAGTHDIVLAPAEQEARPPAGVARESLPSGAGPRLDAVLYPAIDPEDGRARAVSEAVVARLLAAVGLDEGHGPVWVSPDGDFRNGLLRGAWRKPRAAFIGRGAREGARRRRLAELRTRQAQLREQLAALAAAERELAAASASLEEELARMPGDGILRDAHGAAAALQAERGRLAQRVAEAAGLCEKATAAREAAERAVREGAEDLALPTTDAELDAIVAGLTALRVALSGLWPALRESLRAEAERVRMTAEHEEAEREREERARQLSAAAAEAGEREERHQTLRQTVGAAVAELQRRLSEAAAELRATADERSLVEQRHEAALVASGREGERREQLAAAREQAIERRREDVEALRRFATTGLVAVALTELEVPPVEEEWSVTAALRLARELEQELAEVSADDTAWERSQRRVTDELATLADALRRHGNNASARMLEDGIVVDVVFRGHTTSVPALAEALAEEVAQRERLLDEREREILENHLVNEVASTLQELIAAAEEQVLAMNAELAQRPTSTGMRLRLQWRVVEDGPPGLAVARERLLRQAADAWSQDDRAAVGAFLQQQIREVRARDEAGPWVEHLTEALDYRGWHRFVIQRHQGGQWRSASGPASGGERVLAASVPLFAAASSYYASATNPHAPRLVMLDEAFAGVDDDARAKCLGLLTAFDLDVVMTSEREWGCYPEVPGLAIAHLTRVDDIAAVLVTAWEWDGVTRIQVERPSTAAPATPAPSSDSQAPGQDLLWPSPTSDV